MPVNLEQFWAAGISVEDTSTETGIDPVEVQKTFDALNYQFDAIMEAQALHPAEDAEDVSLYMASHFKPTVSQW